MPRRDARLLRRGLFDNGYDELAIGGDYAVAIANLPPILLVSSEDRPLIP